MAFVINHVTMAGGRLVRDAEMKYAANGNARMTFDLAINHSYKDRSTDQFVEQTHFFKVVFWGKRAEGIQDFMKKGTQIALEGRLSQRKWQKDEATTINIIEIVATNIVLMGSKTPPSPPPPPGGAQVENQSAPTGWNDPSAPPYSGSQNNNGSQNNFSGNQGGNFQQGQQNNFSARPEPDNFGGSQENSSFNGDINQAPMDDDDFPPF